MESNLSAFLSVTSKNRHWRKKKKSKPKAILKMRSPSFYQSN